MDKHLINRWEARKDLVKKTLIPNIKVLENQWNLCWDFEFRWKNLVDIVFETILDKPVGIIEINRCFGEKKYQIKDYTNIKEHKYVEYECYVEYGTCETCDTLMHALEADTFDQKIKELMTIALHIVQGTERVTRGE